MEKLAVFICSLHHSGPVESLISENQVGQKMAPIKCPECAADAVKWLQRISGGLNHVQRSCNYRRAYR